MRSLTLGSLMVGLVGGALLIGCGDDSTSAGGSGTGGNAGGQAAGAGNTGAGNTGAGNTGGAGGTTPMDCIEITDVAEFGLIFADGPFVYDGLPTPTLGAAGDDSVQLEIYDPAVTGTVDLSTENDYATCNNCFRAFEDIDPMNGPAKQYFQASGTVNYGTTTPPKIAGSVTDLTLVEVTIDPDTFASTPVPGGSCLHIASLNFDIQAPKDWTCPADQWNGGAGNGCDCACGAPDPDCALDPAEPVQGCMGMETCTSAGTCQSPPPAEWTCMAGFYDGGDGCDCGCGAVDPDCTDATAASCDFCDDMGSCSMVACDDPMSPINMTNNAVCM